MKTPTLPILLTLIGLSSARTDISGCVSSQTTNQWHEASMIWYVPGSGEICDFIDCGGGRAPPKTDQPGCPLYTGTETVTPSYLPGYGPNGSKMAATTTTVSETTSSSSAHATADSSSASSSVTVTNSSGGMITAAPTTSPAVSMTTTTSSVPSSDNSTSSAATSTQTGGAATLAASNVAGVMAMIAVVVGVVSL